MSLGLLYLRLRVLNGYTGQFGRSHIQEVQELLFHAFSNITDPPLEIARDPADNHRADIPRSMRGVMYESCNNHRLEGLSDLLGLGNIFGISDHLYALEL